MNPFFFVGNFKFVLQFIIISGIIQAEKVLKSKKNIMGMGFSFIFSQVMGLKEDLHRGKSFVLLFPPCREMGSKKFPCKLIKEFSEKSFSPEKRPLKELYAFPGRKKWRTIKSA